MLSRKTTFPMKKTQQGTYIEKYDIELI